MNWYMYEVGQQRLGKATDRRVTWYGSSERTTIAVNTILIVAVFKFCHAAEFIENRNCCLKSLTQVPWGNTPAGSEAVADFTQKRFHFVGWHTLAEYPQYLVEYLIIGFWEQILRLRGQTVN